MVKFTISTIFAKEEQDKSTLYVFYVFDKDHQLIRTSESDDLSMLKYTRDLYILLFSNGITLN